MFRYNRLRDRNTVEFEYPLTNIPEFWIQTFENASPQRQGEMVEDFFFRHVLTDTVSAFEGGFKTTFDGFHARDTVVPPNRPLPTPDYTQYNQLVQEMEAGVHGAYRTNQRLIDIKYTTLDRVYETPHSNLTSAQLEFAEAEPCSFFIITTIVRYGFFSGFKFWEMRTTPIRAWPHRQLRPRIYTWI